MPFSLSKLTSMSQLHSFKHDSIEGAKLVTFINSSRLASFKHEPESLNVTERLKTSQR
jgi:hypothetical protein